MKWMTVYSIKPKTSLRNIKGELSITEIDDLEGEDVKEKVFKHLSEVVELGQRKEIFSK